MKVRSGTIVSRVQGYRKKKVAVRVTFDLRTEKGKIYHVVAYAGEHFDSDDLTGLVGHIRKWYEVEVVGTIKKTDDIPLLTAHKVTRLAKGCAPDPSKQPKPEPAAPFTEEQFEEFKETISDKYRRRR